MEFTKEELQAMIDDAAKAAVKIEAEKKEIPITPPAGILPTKGIEGGESAEEKLAKDKKGGFKNAADYLYAVYREHKSLDPRLTAWDTACKTIGTIDPTALGHLVPVEFLTFLLGDAIDASPLLQGMRNIPMQTGTIKLPYIDGFNQSGGLVYGGIKMYWVAEGAQGTASDPKAGTFDMTLHDLMGMCKINRNLMDDSPVSVAAVLQAGFASALNATLNEAIIRGSGAGMPLGILNHTALITVAKESNQTAKTIKAENIAKMFARHYRGGGGSVWLINQDCFPQLYLMSVAVGTGGGPIFIPGNSAAGRPNDMLLGYPIIYFDHASTVGSVGDILLVNMSQYWLGTKAGMDSPRFESNIYLYSEYNQEELTWMYRVDGRSPWPKAFEPPQSAETRSPFVALAARA
jgi:HK97 family phage major capsid protein